MNYGRCDMQKSFASSPIRKRPRDLSLYGRLSIVRFCAAIALFLITIAISFVQNGSSHSTARGALSSNEFSSGMPLP